MSDRTMARDREVAVLKNPVYQNAYTWWIPPGNAPADLFPVNRPDIIVVAHILAVEVKDQFTSGSAYTIRYDCNPKGKEPHLNIDFRWFHGHPDGPMIRESIYTSDHFLPYSGGSTPHQILDALGFPSSGSYGAIGNWRRRT